jgi:adenylate kinase family enzyme
VETPRDQWRVRQQELVAPDTWIVDGNYGATFDIRFVRADTVIVLALPRIRCLVRVLWRTVRHRGRDVQAPGCPERLDLTFLRWVWRYPVDSRPRLDVALEPHRPRLRAPDPALASPGDSGP